MLASFAGREIYEVSFFIFLTLVAEILSSMRLSSSKSLNALLNLSTALLCSSRALLWLSIADSCALLWISIACVRACALALACACACASAVWAFTGRVITDIAANATNIFLTENFINVCLKFGVNDCLFRSVQVSFKVYIKYSERI